MPSENQNQQFLISIDDVKKDFEDFLNIENNDRIFFSGRFGIGKTFFLWEFAKIKEDEYFIIHLYPVNYQIRENSLDIVELLKYDILLELFSYEEELVQETLDKYSEGRNFRSFMKKNKRFLAKTAFDLAGELFDFIKLTGKSLSIMSNVYNTWKSYKRKEELMLEYFLSQQKGELKETDFISQLIWDINNKIEEKTGKKTILILDDLDRLDPDNIFRILNVFSAFFEREERLSEEHSDNNKEKSKKDTKDEKNEEGKKESKNKFGFSKIIIVGDYYNIKNIFHHKYGEATDFQGYMDKFFSIEPYEFDNDKAVRDILGRLIFENKRFFHIYKLDEKQIFVGLVKLIIFVMIEFNLYNLRHLSKLNKYDFSFLKINEYESYEDFVKLALKTLYIVFNGKHGFLEKLESLIGLLQQNGTKVNSLNSRLKSIFNFYVLLFWELLNREFPSNTKNYQSGSCHFEIKDGEIIKSSGNVFLYMVSLLPEVMELF